MVSTSQWSVFVELEKLLWQPRCSVQAGEEP